MLMILNRVSLSLIKCYDSLLWLWFNSSKSIVSGGPKILYEKCIYLVLDQDCRQFGVVQIHAFMTQTLRFPMLAPTSSLILWKNFSLCFDRISFSPRLWVRMVIETILLGQWMSILFHFSFLHVPDVTLFFVDFWQFWFLCHWK